MKCTVVWLEEATDKLTEIWMNAPNRSLVSFASNWIDRTLKNNPEAGEKQNGDYYLRFDPLEIWYSYSPGDCLVTVKEVAHI